MSQTKTRPNDPTQTATGTRELTQYDEGFLRGFVAGGRRTAEIVLDMIRVHGFSVQQVETATRQYFGSDSPLKDARREILAAISESKETA